MATRRAAAAKAAKAAEVARARKMGMGNGSTLGMGDAIQAVHTPGKGK